MASSRLSVNVRDGFLPHFTPGYLDRYGPTSEFVRAVSDHLTLNLAATMDRAGTLVNPLDVARFTDDKAVEVVRGLLRVDERLKRTIFQEAFGTVLLGAVASSVDSALGEGAFGGWLVAFQAREHDRCAEIIQVRERVLSPNTPLERTRER
jgi:hypothetical protein